MTCSLAGSVNTTGTSATVVSKLPCSTTTTPTAAAAGAAPPRPRLVRDDVPDVMDHLQGGPPVSQLEIGDAEFDPRPPELTGP